MNIEIKKISTIIIVCLMVAGSFLSVLILQYPPFSSAWEFEVVDDSTQVGLGSSIAVDSQDMLHISYFDKQQSTLKYAQWDGESWNCMYLNEKLRTGGKSILEIDENDSLHIITAHGNNPGMLYFKNLDDSWTSDNLSCGSHDFSMELNQSGNPQLIITNNGACSVNSINGTEYIVLCDYSDIPLNSRDGSISVDGQDNLHITFQEPIIGTEIYREVRYGVQIGNQWNFETIDNITWLTPEHESQNFRSVNLAIDSTGSPHICYYDESVNAIEHAYKENSQWVTEIVASGDATGISMAIDSEDNICLAYYNTSERDLMFSQKVGNNWYTSTLEKGGITGILPSIAIDSEDGVHISYYDETNDVLKHAFRITHDITYLYLAEIIIISSVIVWMAWSKKYRINKPKAN